ncbi:MAG: hypothetical protein WDO06_06390 [Actinomycetota bacterium]
MSKAPEKVVLEIKERLTITKADIDRISSQLEQISSS